MNRLIVAVDRKNGLAKQGYQPWYIPHDETYFTEQTKSHGGHVLTGGVTFRNSLKSVPLAGRQNYLLTRDETPIEGVTLVHDLPKFLDDFAGKDLWVIGGANVFQQVMDAGKADELYVTHIDADFGCDQFFPEYQDKYELSIQEEPREENGFKFYYAVYRRA